jgi:nitrate reductase beta subunit
MTETPTQEVCTTQSSNPKFIITPNAHKYYDPLTYARSRLSSAKSKDRSKSTVATKKAIEKWSNLVDRALAGEDISQMIYVKTYNRGPTKTQLENEINSLREALFKAKVETQVQERYISELRLKIIELEGKNNQI